MIIPTIPATLALLCGDRISRYSNEGQHFGIFQYFISYQILAPALPRLASIGTEHTALVIVFIPEVQDILLRKIVHLKFMSLDISQHAIFLPERRAGGGGAGAALKWNFKTDCSSAEAEAGEWIHNTLGCIYVSSSKTSAATLLLSIM